LHTLCTIWVKNGGKWRFGKINIEKNASKGKKYRFVESKVHICIVVI
jgi:hypothetical protein